MEDNEMMTATENVEDEALLPDGWVETDDIFDEGNWTGGTADADEQKDDSDQEPDMDSEEAEDIDAPTTEQDDSQEDSQGAEAEEAPTTEQTGNEAPKKLKFSARVDHKDEDVELDEAELPTIYQKAKVTDRVQAKLEKYTPVMSKLERLAKSMGFDGSDALLESARENYIAAEVEKLTNEGVHAAVAQDIVERRFTEAQTKLDADVEPAPAAVDKTPPAKPDPRDYKAEVAELITARPDLKGKTIPDEVVAECAKGKSLLASYITYEAKQTKAEAERLRKENRILKQNAASAAKAPVKGVSGGGKTDTSPKDPFEVGFDSDDW